ncbi:hypothetical protein ABI59_17940 [Acidobacteria bacterium Mor1]|nr:hypothetical protein ABI59_17940 [Acidobacteria bacterium Mor1]
MIVLANIQKLYDGSGAEPSAVSRGVDVHLEGSLIKEVRPHDPNLPASNPDRDFRVIDLSGKTVTPGLIDCHGHVTLFGLQEDDIVKAGGPDSVIYAEKILTRTLIDGGVTTMRDVGGATHALKRMVDDGLIRGPRLKISICMLSTTGGHADFRGPDRCHAELSKLWPPAPGRPSSIVDGAVECRKRVREIKACGADLIKVCSSPGVASPGDELEHREFTQEELTAICDEAAARGMKVAAHAHSASGIELGIACGVHDIQHMSFMDDRLVEQAHEKGCTVTPTSWIIDELIRMGGLDPFVMEKAKQVAEVHARAVEYARKGGLPILMGTDPVLTGMHGRNWMELVHLVRDGLSPLQAWYGSTGLAAAEIGQDDTGVIAPGRRADLLVCDGDVIDDPGAFARGCMLEVIQDGIGQRRGLDGLPQASFEDTTRALLGELPPSVH